MATVDILVGKTKMTQVAEVLDMYEMLKQSIKPKMFLFFARKSVLINNVK